MIKAVYRIISVFAGLLLALGSHISVQASPAPASLLAGMTYYVSTTGNDAGSCTNSAPCKTFSRALSLAQTGDMIYILPGTYAQTLSVSKSDLTIIGNGAVIDASGRSNGVNISGKNITLLGIVVKNSTSHAIIVTGQNVRVADSEVYNSVLECISVESACGSALKVDRLGDGVIFENNYIHNNKSEGIAITRGRNVVVRNNRVTNNSYVEIYVDNSANVRVENNHVFCNQPGSTGIAFDEERYSNWGQELYNLYIGRNIVTGCSRGLGYWGSQGGIKTALIEYNTFHNLSESALYFASGANSNVQIRRNIFPNLKPWFDDNTGITMDDNFWVTTKPGSITKASGPNDKAGTPQYAVTPVWNDPITLMQAPTSPACGYGRWDCSGAVIPSPTSTIMIASATPAATNTPAPSPTATFTSGQFVSTVLTPASLSIGGTSLVSVDLINVPAEGYKSAEFTCTYNAALVEKSNVVAANLFGADPVVAFHDPQNGTFIVAIAGMNDNRAAASGTALTFEIKGLQAGQAQVQCTARVSKGDNIPLDLPSTGASLTVLGLELPPTAFISPTPTLLDDHPPLPTATNTPGESLPPTPVPTLSPFGGLSGQVIASKPVTLSLLDANNVTIASVVANPDGTFNLTALAGNYSMLATASGFLSHQGSVTITAGNVQVLPATSLAAGDIDGNKVVDQFDALTIGMNYTASSPAAADLNNDGVIDFLDLELLARNYRMTGPADW